MFARSFWVSLKYIVKHIVVLPYKSRKRRKLSGGSGNVGSRWRKTGGRFSERRLGWVSRRVFVHVRTRGGGNKQGRWSWRSGDDRSIGVTPVATANWMNSSFFFFQKKRKGAQWRARRLCTSPVIERIATLTSCSLCGTKPYHDDDDWLWVAGWSGGGGVGCDWGKNRSHRIHMAISRHIGICGWLPSLSAFGPQNWSAFARRGEINRRLNSNGLCRPDLLSVGI